MTTQTTEKLQPAGVAMPLDQTQPSVLPKDAQSTREKIIKLAEAFFDLLSNFCGDAASTVRNGLRIQYGFDSASVTAAANFCVVPLTLVQGVFTFVEGIKDYVNARKIGDTEGEIVSGSNEITQGVLTTVAGVFWAACQFAEAPTATIAAKVLEVLGNSINPIFIAISVVNLIFTTYKLIQVVKFGDEFFESIHPSVEAPGGPAAAVSQVRHKGLNKNQKAGLLKFFNKHLRLTKEEERKIEEEANGGENAIKLRQLVLTEFPGIDPDKADGRRDYTDAVQEKLAEDIAERKKKALQVKKEEFERRANGECSKIILDNLDAWNADVNRKADDPDGVTLEQACKKVADTIFWNKVILVAKIAILIAGIIGSILFTIFPGGLLAIALIFLITGIVWVLLDLRGSALWPKIRPYLMSDKLEDYEQDEIVYRPDAQLRITSLRRSLW